MFDKFDFKRFKYFWIIPAAVLIMVLIDSFLAKLYVSYSIRNVLYNFLLCSIIFSWEMVANKRYNHLRMALFIGLVYLTVTTVGNWLYHLFEETANTGEKSKIAYVIEVYRWIILLFPIGAYFGLFRRYVLDQGKPFDITAYVLGWLGMRASINLGWLMPDTKSMFYFFGSQFVVYLSVALTYILVFYLFYLHDAGLSYKTFFTKVKASLLPTRRFLWHAFFLYSVFLIHMVGLCINMWTAWSILILVIEALLLFLYTRLLLERHKALNRPVDGFFVLHFLPLVNIFSLLVLCDELYKSIKRFVTSAAKIKQKPTERKNYWLLVRQYLHFRPDANPALLTNREFRIQASVFYTLFFLQFVLLYYNTVTGVAPHKSILLVTLRLALTAVPFFVYSRLLLERHQALQLPVGWAYVFAFVPLVNLYPLFVTYCQPPQVVVEPRYNRRKAIFTKGLMWFVTCVIIAVGIIKQLIVSVPKNSIIDHTSSEIARMQNLSFIIISVVTILIYRVIILRNFGLWLATICWIFFYIIDYISIYRTSIAGYFWYIKWGDYTAVTLLLTQVFVAFIVSNVVHRAAFHDIKYTGNFSK